jgi:hypothetical protein
MYPAGEENIQKILGVAILERLISADRAFVLMEYFGYLRRNPNDPPEPKLDFSATTSGLTN